MGILDRMMYKMGVIGGKEVRLGNISNKNYKWIDRRVVTPGVGEVGFTFFPIYRALSKRPVCERLRRIFAPNYSKNHLSLKRGGTNEDKI